MSQSTETPIESKIDAFISNRDIYRIDTKDDDLWAVWSNHNFASFEESTKNANHDEYWRLFADSIDKGDILIAQTGSGESTYTYGLGIAAGGYDSEDSKIVDTDDQHLASELSKDQIPVNWKEIVSNGEQLTQQPPDEFPSEALTSVDTTFFKELLRGIEEESSFMPAVSEQVAALQERAILADIKTIIDRHLPDTWNGTTAREQQIKAVIKEYLTETDGDSTVGRRVTAQKRIAAAKGIEYNTVQSKCGREIWESPDDEGYQRGRFDTALEEIEADFEEELAQLQRKLWTPPIDIFDDTPPLETFEELHFPDGLVGNRSLTAQIDDALRSGKHIILTGPPGSGKTEIAQAIADHYVGDDYELATATDDWSTFHTIGGYQPSQNQDDTLDFKPGIFLQRFLDPAEPAPKNEWLIIDELNRADIDKAFGSLLSALTGNTVTLPFENDDGSIMLVGDPNSASDRPLTSRHYYIPDSWRLIATMNTQDKASLYKMSYAFMRRFAFISVPVPDTEEISSELVSNYAETWGYDIDDDEIQNITELWKAVQPHKEIGPALIKDIMAHVQNQAGAGDIDYAYPVRMYIIPQLDALPDGRINGMLNTMVGSGESLDGGGFDR